MTPQKFLNTLCDLQMWGHRRRRAPHKPLLLLLMLGKVKQYLPGTMPYSELEPELLALLGKFAPERKNHRAYYPFKRLCNDGDIWQVEHANRIRTTSSGNFFETDLRRVDPAGGFTRPVERLLKTHPGLIESAATLLLHHEFPRTCHQDVLAAVGLNLPENMLRDRESPDKRPASWRAFVEHTLSRHRIPYLGFRGEVLRLYKGRCAVCNYDVSMDQEPLGLGAAPIRWFSHGGPRRMQNGIALCAIHHHAMDRGGITLDKRWRVQVSETVQGGGNARQELFLKFKGKQLRNLPAHPSLRPGQGFLGWHRREVFRG